MGSEDSDPDFLKFLVDRCAELEARQSTLKSQLRQLNQDNQNHSDEMTSFSGSVTLPGNFRNTGPYTHVLQSINHAVCVTTPSGEIIFWNRAAEKLYGWKDYEATGRCFWELLVEKEYVPYMENIREKLRFGQSWSGQFPFKRRSGEVFMALVTKSPLYEDGELVGAVTVSSDAEVFNNIKSNQPRVPRGNMNRIQWQQRPQIAFVPQMASSISDLASKVLGRMRGDETPNDVLKPEDTNGDRQEADTTKSTCEENSSHMEESVMAQPGKVAAKLFAKIRRKSTGDSAEASESSHVQYHRGQKVNDEPCSTHGSRGTIPDNLMANSKHIPFPGRNARVNENKTSFVLEKDPSPEAFYEWPKVPRKQTSFPPLGLHVNNQDVVPALEKPKSAETEHAAEGLGGAKNLTSSGENLSGSPGSSSSKGDSESSSMVDSDIRWDDLQLGEEVGQGSYAVVYHGLWNGSDVAIKVYFGKDYNEETLLDYKKEISIMRKLRHPNLLLFMGACYSQERLAIVTEFLPRGSLFKILHKSNQMLDLRRRLRMALDVARGMNYLHRRNPPIVHRDLKSSNLLVDKNWNVKVGDFGLSKLKNATFLTAKSGAGTPQWMAPEVLRNDPSNEKSDVFSFGVILWELVTVKIPWDNLNALQVVGVVGFMDRRLDIPDNLDPCILSVINDCWQSKPELRPSFQDVIQRMTEILQSIPATATPPVRKSHSLPS
ncbi:putative serine/threonine-protein kinase SIS8 [Bienertia sinuspersici]